MRHQLDDRTRHDLITTVHYAVRRSPHFRPRKTDVRDVWGNISEEAGRKTAEAIVDHILLSGYSIRPGNEIPPRTEPPAGWAVAWVRGSSVEMGAVCPDDGIPLAVGPRPVLGKAIQNTTRRGMAVPVLPLDGDQTMSVDVYSIILLAELATLTRAAEEAEIVGHPLERRG